MLVAVALFDFSLVLAGGKCFDLLLAEFFDGGGATTLLGLELLLAGTHDVAIEFGADVGVA